MGCAGVYVGIASNNLIKQETGKEPKSDEEDRIFHLESLKPVTLSLKYDNLEEIIQEVKPSSYAMAISDKDFKLKSDLCHKYKIKKIIIDKRPIKDVQYINYLDYDDFKAYSIIKK